MRRYVNSFLSLFNLALTRRSTLDTLVSLRGGQRGSLMLDRIPGAQSHDGGDLGGRDARDLLRNQICNKWFFVDHLERVERTPEVTRRCPLCGLASEEERFRKFDSHCIFGGGVLKRRQCPHCSVIFGPDKMFSLTPEQLAEDYGWHYRAYAEADSTEQELRAFRALSPAREKTYLNYGAGRWSRCLEILRSEGWNVYGYEPHAGATSPAHIVTDAKALAEMRFDGIFSNNVLEHLRNPIDELRRLKTLLRPAALMCHATPCFEYLYEYTRFHLFFYCGQSRNLLLEKADLKLQRFIADGEFMAVIAST